MIRSFADAETEGVFRRVFSRRLPGDIQRIALRKLRTMSNAHSDGRPRMTRRPLPPVHPGEVLLEEFLKPLELSQNRLAIRIGVPPRRINEIVLGKRRVTADTALRLARYFDTTPQFWLGLQVEYDLDVAADELGERLELEVLTHSRAR
jgi:addiction module HigA family antidote